MSDYRPALYSTNPYAGSQSDNTTLDGRPIAASGGGGGGATTFQALTDTQDTAPTENLFMHYDAVQSKHVQTPEVSLNRATRDFAVSTAGLANLQGSTVSLTSSGGFGMYFNTPSSAGASVFGLSGNPNNVVEVSVSAGTAYENRIQFRPQALANVQYVQNQNKLAEPNIYSTERLETSLEYDATSNVPADGKWCLVDVNAGNAAITTLSTQKAAIRVSKFSFLTGLENPFALFGTGGWPINRIFEMTASSSYLNMQFQTSEIDTATGLNAARIVINDFPTYVEIARIPTRTDGVPIQGSENGGSVPSIILNNGVVWRWRLMEIAPAYIGRRAYVEASTELDDSAMIVWNKTLSQWRPVSNPTYSLASFNLTTALTQLSRSSTGVINKHYNGRVITVTSGQTLPSGAIVSFAQVSDQLRVVAPSGGSENNGSSVPIGVLIEDASIGNPVRVAVSGICSVMLGIYSNQAVVSSGATRITQGSGALVLVGRQWDNLGITWYGACDTTGSSPSNAGKVGTVIVSQSIAGAARDITAATPACVLVMLQTGFEAV